MRVPRREKSQSTDAGGHAPRSRAAVDSATALVAEFCAESSGRLRGEAGTVARRIGAELSEGQLRIATLGRVSSGKSTLVNALVGCRMAPTDASECTRVVTCFRYGEQPSATACLQDGQRIPLPEPRFDGSPPELPPDTPGLAYVEVRAPADPLLEVTLIDTPGVSSANSDVSERTHDLVSGRVAGLPTADAVAFVLNQNLREDEYRLLQDVDRSNTLVPAFVHTVGVLAKADLVGGGGTGAQEAARRLARAIAADHRTLLAAVVPVVGLLAEVGNCQLLGEQDAYLIRRLAEDWDAAARETALLAPELLDIQPSTVTPTERRHLLGLLGLAGLRQLLQRVDDGYVSPAALNAACRSISGYDDLRIALVHNFQQRADALKAGRALSALVRAAFGRPVQELAARDRAWFQDRVESLRLDPRMHRILEFEALHRVLAGQVQLPEFLQRDVIRIVERGGRDSSLGAGAWQEFESRATSAGQRSVARVMVRSYAIAADCR
ncbi:dynamin family protein [Blastococcus deserti]|uniref:Dynamin family protein n=1 Tax=Blastococcus deserti TaxID=2259033 RepID=A0ABW4XFT7_9ACTN